jgi:hypothetical protein
MLMVKFTVIIILNFQPEEAEHSVVKFFNGVSCRM